MSDFTYYKIRNKHNHELFRKADGTWNKSGKVYDTLGKLRALITGKLNSNYSTVRDQIHDWEFVEYQVTEKEVKDLLAIVDKKKVWELLQK